MSRDLENLRCYTGLADSAGLESFILWSEVTDGTMRFMRMRRIYTSERGAVIYRVFMHQADVDIVEELLKQRKFKHALYYMKLHAVETQLETGRDERHWDAIPEMSMAEAKEIKEMDPKVTVDTQHTKQLDLL